MSRLATSVGVAAVVALAAIARGQDAPTPPAAFTWAPDRAVTSVVRVTGKNAELRSGPDDNYKAVATVAAGTALPRVGSNPSYYQVLVPGGYHAFVHRRYLDVADATHGRVNTDHVNVRSQPSSSSDYPIGQVNSGTEVAIVKAAGESDEWFEIEAPASLPLWIRQDAVEDLGAMTAELKSEIDGERTGRGTPSGAAERAAANARAQQAQDEAELVRLATVVENAQKEGADVDLAGSRDSVQEILAHATDASIRQRAVELDGKIRTLEQIRDRERSRREAQAAADRAREEQEKLRQAAERATAPPTPAVGSRVTMTGFVRVRPDDGGHPFALEQGTRRLAWITCESGRYRLRDYAGMQVSITGAVSSVDALPILEAERIEIVRQ